MEPRLHHGRPRPSISPAGRSGSPRCRRRPSCWAPIRNGGAPSPNVADASPCDIASSTEELAQWVASNYVQVALPTTLTPAFLDEMTSLPGVQSQIGLSPTFLQLEMASGPDSTLSPDMRFAIALSVDRQALVTRAGRPGPSPSVQVASSHIYAQGQAGYHAAPSTTTTTAPGSAPTTSTSTSTTVIVQGGSVNFPIDARAPRRPPPSWCASGYARAGYRVTGTTSSGHR